MPPNASPSNHDEDDAKEILELQNQISAILMRKRKREFDASEDEVKHLKHRLASSLARCQETNTRLASALDTIRKVRTENELLERETKKQVRSVKALEDENKQLKTQLENLKKNEATSKKAVSDLKKKLGSVLEAFSEV
ncbi:hypothetical protein KCU81_g4421, partial [Aureobasidium melanogenum]|uniref:Uncharacterized protein n=1 Tax=Aureobasidium melanogenum (strain CBS 110374) TaxID=1043003 RepID=A0A074W8R9_AURM1